MVAANISISDQLPKSLIGRLVYYSKTNPKHDAIISSKLKISYLQLLKLVQTQASLLRQNGMSRDSVIGIKCSDDIEHLVLTLAAISIGTTSFTVPSHEEQEVQKAISTRCGVTDIVNAENVIDLLKPNYESSETTPENHFAKLLFSTSGTTGDPKIVVHQDIDLVSQAHRHINSSQERFVCLASIDHNFVKRHRLYCLAMGATNIFIENNHETLVEDFLSLEANVLHVSAFQAQELLGLSNINSLSKIRLKLGGSHVHAFLREQLRENFTQNIQAGYGTTETGAISFTDPDDIDDQNSVGRALPGIEARIVTTDRSDQVNGENGEIAIRCEGMFREYLGNAELTSSRLENEWFYTGDIGYLDDQQRIHLSGRSDDMFTFNSINIYPQDIESQLQSFSGIADAAVLPKTSSQHNNIPIALVVFDKSIKPDLPALKKFMKKKAGIRCPRQFAIVDEIPRNSSGKISRKNALHLCTKSDDVRETIIQILADHATDHVKPAMITAFINGDTDIKLRKFKLDSLARMDLLVALEVSFNTIITPHELAQFRYLGNLVARVLSTQEHFEAKQQTHTIIRSPTRATCFDKSQFHIVNLCRRIFSFCQTVAQLNKTLATLENRLTPLEVENLYESYHSQQLLSSEVDKKFHSALKQWLQSMKNTMYNDEEKKAEPFICKRMAPTVRHYTSHKSLAHKTLLICFTAAGARNMGMPNAVLLQHMNANKYDLLVITEPLNEKYLQGVPYLGKNVNETIEWLVKLPLTKNYEQVRTVGYSAGSYPAIIAGCELEAEIAVSIGGRFHTKSHPIKFLQRLFTTWQTVRKKQCSQVLMAYSTREPRDRLYAKIIAMFTSSKLLEINIADENINHLFLGQLVERGELADFFSQTIFTDIDDQCTSKNNSTLCINFPIDKSSLC
ncbi:MAG: fatty acid--CoA ligase family protein [Pseudomonadota bacterium]